MTAVWSPSRPRIAVPVDFAHLDSSEIRVYQDLGGAELRAAIELISPANKDRAGSRRTFAAKCAGYLQHGIGLVTVDIVTSQAANLHAELFEVLEVKSRRTAWASASGLSAVAYRAVTVRKNPRVEAWPEPLALARRCRSCRCGWPWICAFRCAWKKAILPPAGLCGYRRKASALAKGRRLTPRACWCRLKPGSGALPLAGCRFRHGN